MADLDTQRPLVTPGFVDALATALSEKLARNAFPRKWLSAAEAAAYLRCPVSRVRKLTMTGELPVHRDGRRVLFDIAELDEFVRQGGAISP